MPALPSTPRGPEPEDAHDDARLAGACVHACVGGAARSLGRIDILVRGAVELITVTASNGAGQVLSTWAAGDAKGLNCYSLLGFIW